MEKSLELKFIWIVRHGESRGNTGEESDLDPELTETGRDQAGLLHNALGHLRFDAVYLSPLRRTRQTFELSDVSGKHVIFDTRILEYRWPGLYATLLPYEDLPEYGVPDQHYAWEVPFSVRISEFAEEVAYTDFDNVLLVTHGGAAIELTRAFLSRGNSCPDQSCLPLHYLDNTGIAYLRLGRDGKKCRLGTWNHTGHLELSGAVRDPRN